MSEAIEAFVEEVIRQWKTLSPVQLANYNEKQRRESESEYRSFLEHYEKDNCYLCSKPFKTMSAPNPCLHWLLRRSNKFKKKNFLDVTKSFDFHNIEAFLRWVAHAEAGSLNINDLHMERSERKIFETTIRWRNLEWTLDCSESDFKGHPGTRTNFPHWHFQMRIDGRQFINFNDFHVKFSDYDRFLFALKRHPNAGFLYTYGPGGSGMQDKWDMLTRDPERFLANVVSTSEPEEASLRMQTIVMGGEGGISGEKIDEAMKMSRETGKPLAHCIREVTANDKNILIKTIVSPSDSVPEIARRTERKRR